MNDNPLPQLVRPVFLYLCYIMVGFAIPVGILNGLDSDFTQAMIEGMQAWLNAIPESFWAVLGASYLGYTGARTYEKTKSKKEI